MRTLLECLSFWQGAHRLSGSEPDLCCVGIETRYGHVCNGSRTQTSLEKTMKLVKSLFLGSVAGLAAAAGAQAADLPVAKAAAVEYVRVCSTYGAGFFYIPGTE